ncbi:MAG: class I SAM-dependent methyltransferase [Cyclobacteriaceae bacterium]|nr:class I SAM-dependent methyltransferase [Cyclobacteriaceae bacterium]UYN88605.1 MAG: class I SAM-dependent methyltransferase [Cyclobacteriaceae bacterium]
MDFLNADLVRYAEQHTSSESELLKRINRETHAQVLMPRMLSGHLQGRLLAMVSSMLRPKRILEIGTYTGYSAICLAEGLAPQGILITIDINEELEDRVRQYFNEAGISRRVDYRIGNALEIIPQLQGPFDLVFIDADKENYARYYDLVFNLVPLGGYILADNVLWSGKVLDQKPDKDTRAIMAFNLKVQQDKRVENLLLPVRDGIMIARKVRD